MNESHVFTLQGLSSSVSSEYLGPNDVPEPPSSALESTASNGVVAAEDQAATSFMKN